MGWWTWVNIVSGNGLSPVQYQAINWTSDLSTEPIETSSEIWIKIQKLFFQENAFKYIVCIMVIIKSRPAYAKW